jgi:hypothetical protein
MILVFSIFALCARNEAGELIFEQLYNHPSPIDIFLISGSTEVAMQRYC